MVLNFDRPASYQSHMLNTYTKFEHTLNLKHSEYADNFFTKDPSFSPYCEEPSMNDFKHKLEFADGGSQSLISWTRRHPQHWTKREVLDWIYFVVDQEHLDGSKLQGEAYNNFIGEDLCKMDRKQFLKADPYYGSKMYETFRNLINDVTFEEPKPVSDISCLDTFNVTNNMEYSDLNRNIQKCVLGGTLTSAHDNSNNDNRHNNGLMVIRSDHDIKVNLSGLGIYSISPEIELPNSNLSFSQFTSKLRDGEQFTQPILPFSQNQLPEFSFISSSNASNISPYTKHRSSSLSSTYPSTLSNSLTTLKQSASQKSLTPSSYSSSLMSSTMLSLSSSMSLSLMYPSSSSSPCRIDKTDTDYFSDDSCTSPIPSYQSLTINDISIVDAMKVGIDHHHSMSLSTSYNEKSVKPKKKDKKNRTKNGNHLWEFVRELLRDPEANPKFLKWEDKESGVFRFVQSEKVAQLWGEKKNNPQMTYEKLSRAMRFCRSAGYFDMVPKTGKFPKKLCFRFGDKARGWKD